jgi:hypothetical protein
MTQRITVFHTPISGNGDNTVFTGPDLEYCMEEDGALRIIKWETSTQKGDALFAPGQWTYVCRVTGPNECQETP